MADSGLKILLIDDDHDDAEMIIYALRKITGIEVKYVDDGAQALEYLLSDSCDEPSLILLDLKMPRVDGIDILRVLKRTAGRSHIPVAAMISSKSGIDYLESFGTSPDAYLHKPVSTAEFLQVIAKVGLQKFENRHQSFSIRAAD